MGDFVPSARIIADSISAAGHRLTTVEVKLHRYVLAEINTHRQFSRSSASSRAIPVRKTLERILDEPAVPLVWATEQKGMRGGPPLDPMAALEARTLWLAARDTAIAHAHALTTLGVHKSITNRLLEPFMSHAVIISATDWSNFFDQRCTPSDNRDALAQAELVAAADAIRTAMDNSTPREIPLGGWHTPYVDDWEIAALPRDVIRHISVARCARVSYLNHAGKRSTKDDLALYEKLINAQPPHASPLEHVATPAAADEPTQGNFTGWLQLRHQLLAERKPA